MSPIIIKCRHCGFTFYNGKDLKEPNQILKEYGFLCPCCLSPIPRNEKEWIFEIKIRKKPETE